MTYLKLRPTDVVQLASAPLESAAGPCCWYAVSTGRICWSPALPLPLVIEHATRDGVWIRIATVDRSLGPIPARTFTADASVARVDLDHDLDHDLD